MQIHLDGNVLDTSRREKAGETLKVKDNVR